MRRFPLKSGLLWCLNISRESSVSSEIVKEIIQTGKVFFYFISLVVKKKNSENVMRKSASVGVATSEHLGGRESLKKNVNSVASWEM